MLVPAALTLAVFPTAMGDISENYAIGRWFPLTTPEHPPMQVWITGLVGAVLSPNALSAILAGQALNLLAAFYLWRTLLLVVDSLRAALFAFLFATTLYFIAAPLSWALNADILQIPIWAGAVYHLMRAAETDRWGHWIGFALWLAAAGYTKFSAAILVGGLLIASLVVPDYRRQWRNPRFLAAAALVVVLCLPYALALRLDPSAVSNAATRVNEIDSLASRAAGFLRFLAGFAVFLLPGWAIVGIGLLRRDFGLHGASSAGQPGARFLRWTFLGCVVITVAMIFGLGLYYVERFDAPLFALAIAASAPLVTVDPLRWPRAETRVLGTAAIVAAATLVIATAAYTLFTAHDNMQEPFPEAAAIVRADWDRRYACGPGYYIGDRRTAHGMGLADRKPVAIAIGDLPRVHWFDPGRLRQEGAALVFSGPAFPADAVAAALPGFAATEARSFTLPLLRTLTGARVGYSYAFVAPADCPPKAGG